MTNPSCPSCGTTFVQFTVVPADQDTKPEVGDIGICSTCGGLHVVVDDGSFQEAGEQDLVGLDERTRRALAAAQRLVRGGAGKAAEA